MSPLREAADLQSICMERFIDLISQSSKEEDNLLPLRKYICLKLGGRIRQRLINFMVDNLQSYQMQYDLMLRAFGLMLDSAIEKIDASKLRDWHHILELMEAGDCTGVKELNLPDLNSRRCFIDMKHAKIGGFPAFKYLFTKGLGENLQHLTMRNTMCENDFLKLLGQHANQLKYLDVTANWSIDDMGIENLLLKDSSCFSGDYHNLLQNIGELALVARCDLNPLCFTLTDIRIDGTNTTVGSICMLLFFAKKLQRFDSVMVDRYAGDAVLRVSNYRPKLELVELYDNNLLVDKIEKLALALPELKSLYLKGIDLKVDLDGFKKLNSLNLEIDKRQALNFGDILKDHYFSKYGNNLVRLNVKTNTSFIDLTTIAHFCPKLKNLTASWVSLDNYYEDALLEHLETATLYIHSSETFRWLMMRAGKLETLKIVMVETEHMPTYNCRLMDDVFTKLVDCHAPGLNSIIDLTIELENQYVGGLSVNTIKLLVNNCKYLRRIGDLKWWFTGSSEGLILTDLIDPHMKELQRRYDVEFICSGKAISTLTIDPSLAERDLYHQLAALVHSMPCISVGEPWTNV